MKGRYCRGCWGEWKEEWQVMVDNGRVVAVMDRACRDAAGLWKGFGSSDFVA